MVFLARAITELNDYLTSLTDYIEQLEWSKEEDESEDEQGPWVRQNYIIQVEKWQIKTIYYAIYKSEKRKKMRNKTIEDLIENETI